MYYLYEGMQNGFLVESYIISIYTISFYLLLLNIYVIICLSAFIRRREWVLTLQSNRFSQLLLLDVQSLSLDSPFITKILRRFPRTAL